MWIYILIASIIFFGGLTKKADYVFKTSIVFLCVFTALRDPSLGDFGSFFYQDFFEKVPLPAHILDFNSPYAFGYTIFNSIVKIFSDNYLFFQAIYAVVSLFLLYIVISLLKLTNREKCLFLFSYFCFHFLWNTWITYRQNLANLIFWIFLILFTKSSIHKKSISKYLFLMLMIFVPPLFHTSAWVNIGLLCVYWLFTKLGSKKLIYIVPILSIVFFFNTDFIFNHFLQYILSIDARYSMYDIGVYRSLNFINLLLKLFFFIYFALFYETEKYEYKNMVLSSTAIVVILGSINAELMTRMYEYYAIGLYTCIALTFRNMNFKSKVILYPIFFIAFVIILVRSVMVFGDGIFMDYRLFLLS